MTNLKVALNEYLSRNEQNNDAVSVSIGLKTLEKLFKTPETEDNEDLLTGEPKYFGSHFFPSLSWSQKMVGFCVCICISAFFFGLSLLYIPVIVLKARKFALMFTMGSCSFLCSFSFLWGPVNYLKHIFSTKHLFCTALYFSSLLTTLYFALWLRSTPLTALFALVQIMSLIWFLISYIPGGRKGLHFFGVLFKSAVTSSVSKSLPV